jgi:Ca-activated chloride channel family protein
MIVFLTDGLATAGITIDDDIRRLITEINYDRTVRIHAFGVGYDVNTHLLDGLAADNGGTVTYVQPGENIETVLTGFYSRIANPVLTDVQIEFDGIEAVDLYPQALPDLFEGSSVILAGRYTATSESSTVRVTGRAGGEAREYVYEFNLAETGEHSFVSRLWATRRIGHLLDIVRVEGETGALREEIRAIGLAYGIVTPYTTFVIAPQTDGAASASNMELYSDLDSLNRSSGSTTVRARVQNQMYQDSSNVAWAQGANIVSAGRNNLMQVGSQYIDLGLVAQQPGLDEGITPEWIAANIDVDIMLTFGSPEYFALASDPDARPLLQNGTDIIFPYNGQTYWVQDGSSDPQ